MSFIFLTELNKNCLNRLSDVEVSLSSEESSQLLKDAGVLIEKMIEFLSKSTAILPSFELNRMQKVNNNTFCLLLFLLLSLLIIIIVFYICMYFFIDYFFCFQQQ